jgi:membrane protein YqaA with SNARE-associated domain
MGPTRKQIFIWQVAGGGDLLLAVSLVIIIGGPAGQLAGYFLYSIVACTCIPLPTTPYVIAMGNLYHPVIVAFIGTVGNCIAAWIEYYVIFWVFSKIELTQKLQQNPIFQRYTKLFHRATFAWLVFAGFSAIPFEPFRIAAILIRYSIPKYLLSVFIGRMPRYYLVAMIGARYHLPAPLLILITVVLMVIPVGNHYLGDRLKNFFQRS